MTQPLTSFRLRFRRKEEPQANPPTPPQSDPMPFVIVRPMRDPIPTGVVLTFGKIDYDRLYDAYPETAPSLH